MRNLSHLSTFVIFWGLTLSNASAGTLNISTGLDATGNANTAGNQLDANWTADPNPDFSPNPTGTVTYSVFPNNNDWWSGWLANDTDSTWINRDSADLRSPGSGPYSYYRTFSLLDTTDASVSGSWGIDDSGLLILNGKVIGSLSESTNNWSSLTAFSDTNASDFLVGVNTLELQISAQTDNALDGVRLTGTVTGDLGSATPEPSTGLLLAVAAVVVGTFRKRTIRS